MLQEPDGFLYAMRQGYVHVINNETFDYHSPRTGSQVDVCRLQKFFEDTLHWRFHIDENKSVSKMKNIIAALSEKDFNKFDALFLFILSHGTKYGICGTDSDAKGELNIITESEILSMFDSTSCPSLANKPKIFMFQACRGDLDDQGYSVCDTDAVMVKPPQNYKINIPNFSEFLLVYPCIPGYTALRNQRYGTYFINALVDELEKYHRKEDLLKILVRVNFKVAHQENSLCIKSMPCQDHRLSRLTYFHGYFIEMKKALNNRGHFFD